MEFSIIETLLALNAAGWGVAWVMFRRQFGDLGGKVDAISDRMSTLGERIARLEGRAENSKR